MVTIYTFITQVLKQYHLLYTSELKEECYHYVLCFHLNRGRFRTLKMLGGGGGGYSLRTNPSRNKIKKGGGGGEAPQDPWTALFKLNTSVHKHS